MNIPGLQSSGIMAPIEPPKTLERLADDAERIIKAVENGRLDEFLAQDKIFWKHDAKQVHRYQRLFDYLEKGFEARIAGEICHMHDAQRLWNYYEIGSSNGSYWMGSRMGIFAHIEPIKGITSPQECHDNYIKPVKDAWNSLESIKPGDKEKISMMRHFNKITRAVENFELNKEMEWGFNDEKDEWEYDYRKDILIIRY